MNGFNFLFYLNQPIYKQYRLHIDFVNSRTFLFFPDFNFGLYNSPYVLVLSLIILFYFYCLHGSDCWSLPTQPYCHLLYTTRLYSCITCPIDIRSCVVLFDFVVHSCCFVHSECDYSLIYWHYNWYFMLDLCPLAFAIDI